MEVPEFECGEVVRMISDIAEAYQLQQGHGEWNDDMALVGRLTICLKAYICVLYVLFVWSICLLSAIHEQSIREMLRKARQQQQHNRKAKQHNTTRPKQSFFKEKLAALGGTRTHDHQLARRCSYQLSYRGSSAGWAASCIQM